MSGRKNKYNGSLKEKIRNSRSSSAGQPVHKYSSANAYWWPVNIMEHLHSVNMQNFCPFYTSTGKYNRHLQVFQKNLHYFPPPHPNLSRVTRLGSSMFKHRHRLPRETVNSLSMQILKSWLNTALSNLLQVALLEQWVEQGNIHKCLPASACGRSLNFFNSFISHKARRSFCPPPHTHFCHKAFE